MFEQLSFASDWTTYMMIDIIAFRTHCSFFNLLQLPQIGRKSRKRGTISSLPLSLSLSLSYTPTNTHTLSLLIRCNPFCVYVCLLPSPLQDAWDWLKNSLLIVALLFFFSSLQLRHPYFGELYIYRIETFPKKEKKVSKHFSKQILVNSSFFLLFLFVSFS